MATGLKESALRQGRFVDSRAIDTRAIAPEPAQRAYEAFCSSFGRTLPSGTSTWDELPEMLQASWKAAAAAARD